MADDGLRALLDAEAHAADEAAAEDDDGQPLTANVTVSRPNLASSKVLMVRLNPDEFDAIERIAAERDVPAATLGRAAILRLIADVATKGA